MLKTWGGNGLKKILILTFYIYTLLILFSCNEYKSENINKNAKEEDIIFNSPEQSKIPSPTQLSDTLYPEWIFLSENSYNSAKIYSPIDYDYNIRFVNQDFIGDTAYEFIEIWRQEMDFQYNKCIENMPEKHKIKFIEQQEAWQKYIDNDVFPEIAFYGDEEELTLGYGFTRESFLIYMDRIRARTIEIMRIECFINDTTVEFHYKSIE